MSTFSSIIDDIRTHLEGLSFSQNIDFSDTIIPRAKVEDLGGVISGILFPGSLLRERINRSGVSSTYTINIAVTKKVKPGDDSEVDGLVGLVEEVAASLDELVTASSRSLSVTIDPVYDFERLRENNVFTSIIKADVRGI